MWADELEVLPGVGAFGKGSLMKVGLGPPS